MIQITPIGLNLLLEPIKDEAFSEGGILLPDSSRIEPSKGKILEVGNEIDNKHLVKGVAVLFKKGAGNSVHIKGKDYLILPLKEVIGALKESEVK